MGQGLFNFSANVSGNQNNNQQTGFDVSPFLGVVNTAQSQMSETMRLGTQMGAERGRMVQQSFSKVADNFTAGLQLGMQEKLQRLQNCQANAANRLNQEKFEYEKNANALGGEYVALKKAIAENPTDLNLNKKLQEFTSRKDVLESGIFASKELQNVVAPFETQATIGLSTRMADELELDKIFEDMKGLDVSVMPSAELIVKAMSTGKLDLVGKTYYAKGYDTKTNTYTPLPHASNPQVQAMIATRVNDALEKIKANQLASVQISGTEENIKSSIATRTLFKPTELKQEQERINETKRNNMATNAVSVINANTNSINADANYKESVLKQSEGMFKQDQDTLKDFKETLTKGEDPVLGRQVVSNIEGKVSSPHKINASAESAVKDITALKVFKNADGSPQVLSESNLTRIQNLYNNPEYASLQSQISLAILNGKSYYESIQKWVNPKPTTNNPAPNLAIINPLSETDPRKALAALEYKRLSAIPNLQSRLQTIQASKSRLALSNDVSAVKEIYLANPIVNEAFNATESQYANEQTPAPQAPLTKKGVENAFGIGKKGAGTFSTNRLFGN